MKHAFKEWAVVVDALGRGEQILILRKGGIREGKAGFQLKHERFLLFPTQFHQQRESVTPSAQERFDTLELSTNSTSVSIEYFTEVAASFHLEDYESVAALKGQHIWRDEVIQERYDWGSNKGIFAIVTRVYRLKQPASIEVLPEYGGCKSWIELDREIDISDATPVLSEEKFQQKLQTFYQAVKPVAQTEPVP